MLDAWRELLSVLADQVQDEGNGVPSGVRSAVRPLGGPLGHWATAHCPLPTARCPGSGVSVPSVRGGAWACRTLP